MVPEIKKVFDKEVADIRRNPRLVGDWGYLQDYLRQSIRPREGKTSGSSVFSSMKTPDGRSAGILINIRNGIAQAEIRLVKKEYFRPGSCNKLKPGEYDEEIIPLPDDLQGILTKEVVFVGDET